MRQEYITQKLKNSNIAPRVLLARARLGDAKKWDTSEMSDPKYLPFYYYLGQQTKAVNVLEYGFGLGLVGACFCQGTDTVQKYAGFQRTTDNFYYSFRLGSATLQEYYQKYTKLAGGGINEFKRLAETDQWDMVFVSQKIDSKFFRDHMEIIWANSKPDALIVVDHLAEKDYQEGFVNWCQTKNRTPELYETRYQLGLIVR